MKNLVPIGRFSTICRLSLKALRLYDEMGLLRPALVDPGSGYRSRSTTGLSSTLPGGRVAYTLHAGAYDAVGPTYAALQRWIQEHGHESDGPPREIYLVGPAQANDPAAFRTEVQWPIR